MSLSSKEAAETLVDVEQAARRSARAFGYARAAPHLMMWGVIWVLGYLGTDFRPGFSGEIWFVLCLAGSIGGTYLARCAGADGALGAHNAWRAFAIVFIIFCFIMATYLIMGPLEGAQQAAFPPLLMGAAYAGLGLWAGMRFVALGAATVALTLIGFFALREHFLIWEAFVGGGGLILAGFWFRMV